MEQISPSQDTGPTQDTQSAPTNANNMPVLSATAAPPQPATTANQSGPQPQQSPANIPTPSPRTWRTITAAIATLTPIALGIALYGKAHQLNVLLLLIGGGIMLGAFTYAALLPSSRP